MNDPMPPYWKPPRRRYASYVLPALALVTVFLVIAAALVVQAQAPASLPACQPAGPQQ